MQDAPTPPELLDSVAAFLRAEVLPQLDGATAFGLRVSIGALDLVRRELTRPADEDRAETVRLRTLVGAEDGVEALTAELARRILAGEASLDTAGLAEHLWTTTGAKLAVDQPGYAGWKRALALRAREGEE